LEGLTMLRGKRRNVALVSALTCVFVLALHASGFAAQVPEIHSVRPAEPLPPIFAQAGPAARLAAEEVARQDAYRKLAERVSGFALDAQTDVYDCVLASHQVHNGLRGKLCGMRQVKIEHFDDGRVAIWVKITIRQVVEVIEKAYKQVKRGERLVSEERLNSIKVENRDRDLVAVGFGALKGGPGLAKIRAMRAAELDAYRRIAARVRGLKVDADTTVGDFMLHSDAIRSKVSVGFFNGVVFSDYRFGEDGLCEVDGTLTIRQVVEVLTRTYRRHMKGGKLVKLEDIGNLERKHRDLVFKETGQGAPRAERATATDPFAFEEQKTVFEKVLRQERVIEEGVLIE